MIKNLLLLAIFFLGFVPGNFVGKGLLNREIIADEILD